MTNPNRRYTPEEIAAVEHFRSTGVWPGKSSEKKFERDASENGEVITAISSTIRTLADAIRVAKVDLAVWEVERYVINKWDNVAKVKKDGNHTLKATELWQVKVWLKRKVPKVVEDGLKILINRIAKASPKCQPVKYAKISDPHMLIMDLCDAHFGKLAWAAETGTECNLSLTEKVFEIAFEDILAKTRGFPIEVIEIPLGNDFFHIDYTNNSTAGGTPQDVAGRYVQIFKSGEMAVMKMIEKCRLVAPVVIRYVPGNHDPVTSWHLVHWLKGRFHDDKSVTIDDGPSKRKFIHYGKTLIGMSHGDKEKHASLPNIMAGTWPMQWAASAQREWLLGHLHKEKEVHYVGADTHDGVVVRTMRSISGTDAWHYQQGYVNTMRAATALLYSKSRGYTGQFSSNVEA